MIAGIGTDIVDIRRIEKLLDDKFIARCFTKVEQEYAEKKKPGGGHIAAYARTFAAKEACAKALGSGIGETVSFTDIEITRDDKGKPQITLLNIEKSNHPKIHLSLSDEPPYALAYVIIESNP